MAISFYTPWEYDTSEETSGSIDEFSGGAGKIYLKNSKTKAKLAIKYSFISVAFGNPKGYFLNYAKSLASDPSGGFTNVIALHPSTFGKGSFPCNGWIIMGGGSAGVFQLSFMSQSGADLALIVFGEIPFAAVPTWGRFNSIMPGAGVSRAFVRFYL